MDIAPDFEDFYRRDRDRLAAALGSALGDTQLGAEAIDEAMARAYQHWSKVGSYSNPAGWVYRVARNWAVTRLRRRRFLSDSPPPEPQLDMAPEHHDLLMRLRALPEPQRQVVVLKYLLGWSQDEIAKSLNLRPGTVKSRLSRALAQLRIELADLHAEEQR